MSLSDSGRALEIVDTRRRGRFALFIHQVGRSELRGAYDAIPTDAQIVKILAGTEPSPVRAVIERTADGNAAVTVDRPTPAPAPAAPRS